MVLSYSAGAGLQAMRLRDTTNVGLYDGLMWNECQHSVCCIQHTVMRRQQRLVTVGELRSREASFEGAMGSQMNGMAWGRLHADANAAKREVCVLACGHSSSHATIRLTLIAAVAMCCKWVSRAPGTWRTGARIPGRPALLSVRPRLIAGGAWVDPELRLRPTLDNTPIGAVANTPLLDKRCDASGL